MVTGELLSVVANASSIYCYLDYVWLPCSLVYVQLHSQHDRYFQSLATHMSQVKTIEGLSVMSNCISGIGIIFGVLMSSLRAYSKANAKDILDGFLLIEAAKTFKK